MLTFTAKEVLLQKTESNNFASLTGSSMPKNLNVAATNYLSMQFLSESLRRRI